MKVKLCGLCREEDIAYANEAGPDYVGFVFAKSRRQISREQAKRYRQLLHPAIQVVGVFVEEAPEVICSLWREGIIDVVQLHGAESEEVVEAIKKACDCPVIRARKVSDGEQPVPKEALLQETAADYLLFDSGSGSGKVFDWAYLEAFRDEIKKPFFLAGGLQQDNIPKAIERLKPYGIDLSSGVETEGKKDRQKMIQIVQTVKEIEQNCLRNGNEMERHGY